MRMRRPKVLLEIDGDPMVRRVVMNVIAIGARPVIVVAGPEVDGIRSALASLEAAIVENRDWQEGLGSSIRRGIESLADGAVDGALVLLADQPFVTQDHLRGLVAAFEGGEDPVATRYGDSRGVPALFGSKWFTDLRALTGDRGAKTILDRSGATAVGDGAPPVDIDTEEDYERASRR
jgi:CTP:molybdopterin cytidylyltransferase MocA